MTAITDDPNEAITETLRECNPTLTRSDYVVHLLWRAADEIEDLLALVSEVVACMDADDYWQLTELYPRLLAAGNGSKADPS